MSFLLNIIIIAFFIKLFIKCVQESEKFFEVYNTINNEPVKNKAVKVNVTEPFKGYLKAQGKFNDSVGVITNMQGHYDIYVDKKGKFYAQGLIQGDNPYLISKPSIIVADIEHMGQRAWYDEYGVHEAMVERRQNGEVPIGNYFLYHPKKCPICGTPIDYKPQDYPMGDNEPMYLSAPLDSHDRRCPHCNEILKKDDKVFYPFFIDTINKKCITSKDKEFNEYMKDCDKIQHIYEEINEIPSADRDWINFDETLLVKENLSEYTKNAHEYNIAMWEVFKALE